MDIYFKEDGHIYFAPEFPDKKFTSVSKVFDYYKPKFKKDEIAAKYLKKGPEYIMEDICRKWKIDETWFKDNLGDPYGFDVDDILRIWELKSSVALKKGTYFHKREEEKALSKTARKGYESKDGLNKALDCSKLEPGEYTELIIPYIPMWLIGTADKVVVHEDKHIEIFDFKTDNELNFKGTAYYNQQLNKKVVEKLKHPLSYIDNVNGQHYNIKMSMYAYFLEQYGYKFKSGTIQHVQLSNHTIEDLENGYEPEIVDYPMTYMKKEVETLLKHYKLSH